MAKKIFELFGYSPNDAVYNKIMDRLGNELADYPLKNNSLTFLPIQLCEPIGDGVPRALRALKPKTTTIQQVQIAFSSPTNLPEAGSCEKAIRAALGEGYCVKPISVAPGINPPRAK